jgi:hypothetical protein
MELLLLMVLSSLLWQSNLDTSLHTPPYIALARWFWAM